MKNKNKMHYVDEIIGKLESNDPTLTELTFEGVYFICFILFV